MLPDIPVNCLYFWKVRIWARKNVIEDGQGSYALSITQPILEFFEKYYNTSYPLSKSGMIIFFFHFPPNPNMLTFQFLLSSHQKTEGWDVLPLKHVNPGHCIFLNYYSCDLTGHHNTFRGKPYLPLYASQMPTIG